MLRFMVSPAGRWTRVALGAVLVSAGVASRRPLLALFGLAPLVTGAADLCLVGPLFGMSVSGADIRRRLGVVERPWMPADSALLH